MPGSVPLYDQTMVALQGRYPLLAHALTRHSNQRGAPMSFQSRPALIELYATLPKLPRAGIVKSPQTGVSELLIQLALHEAGELGRIVGYVLPGDRIRDRFVLRRINPLLLNVPAYRRRLPGVEQDKLTAGDTGNLRSKPFGAGLILFLGAGSDGDFVEFSADTLILDEYDLCLEASRDNVGKAFDRVLESPSPRVIQLGNPEMPRDGIERVYDEGDRRIFCWRCGHCGHYQPIEWAESIVRRSDSGQWTPRDPVAAADPNAPLRPVCTRCHAAFTRDPEHAAWIAQTTEIKRDPSYRMTRWDDLREQASLRSIYDEWIAAQASSRLVRLWWRRNAGRAFEDSSSAILREDLLDASVLERVDHVGGDAYEGATTAGIDVGSIINVNVSQTVRPPGRRAERHCRYIGTTSTPEGVLDILRRYRVRTCVIDANPERRMAQQIKDQARALGCTVWLCEFQSSVARAGVEEFGLRTDPAGRVMVDRTQLLDAAADCIRAGATVGRLLREGQTTYDAGIDGARLWPSDAVEVQGWDEQMRASTRVTNDKGKIVWDEAGRPDHYRFSDAYDLLAQRLDSSGADFF